ncbi:enoyl-CoA hydratase-related protein [Massilibacterium senegalense]|uniref:enoyl-CoA hydratase-related protein n=1 Tax=Massilibacterium senegalense TaxID=1632858 RepID=UPI00078145F7|nr:enoyl-CoA hydratase-related protein [Massilibacterium senegalense]
MLVTKTIDRHVATVTLCREEALNCLNYDALVQMQQIVEELHTDRDIRVVVFIGAGEKAFSAGADLKERRHLTETEVRRNVKAIRELFTSMEKLPMVTIAAINGHALGGGLEWALACDFRIAAAHATLGLTEVRWAIIPGAGGTQRLPRLIGYGKAMEMILLAKRISADEARQIGLVHHVVPFEQLHAAVDTYVEQLLQNGPCAVAEAKFAIREGMNTDMYTGMEIEKKAYEMIIPTNDRIEALRAFQEKRRPNFQGT